MPEAAISDAYAALAEGLRDLAQASGVTSGIWWLVSRPEPKPPKTKDLIEGLRSIDWFQFEKVIALVYRKQG